ncbi:MAG TPA: hypothetical protein VEY70_06995 [Metabacillus sp.]|nr:hypothetical protein [Metabacillus sp.]
MEEIDFSPLQDTLNGIAIKLGVFGLLALFIGIFLKFILVKMGIPNKIAGSIASVVMVIVAFNYLTRIFEM